MGDSHQNQAVARQASRENLIEASLLQQRQPQPDGTEVSSFLPAAQTPSAGTGSGASSMCRSQAGFSTASSWKAAAQPTQHQGPACAWHGMLPTTCSRPIQPMKDAQLSMLAASSLLCSGHVGSKMLAAHLEKCLQHQHQGFQAGHGLDVVLNELHGGGTIGSSQGDVCWQPAACRAMTCRDQHLWSAHPHAASCIAACAALVQAGSDLAAWAALACQPLRVSPCVYGTATCSHSGSRSCRGRSICVAAVSPSSSTQDTQHEQRWPSQGQGPQIMIHELAGKAKQPSAAADAAQTHADSV